MKRFNYFPDIWGSLLILSFLISLEMLIAAFFFDFGVVFKYGDPRAFLVKVIANGIIFSVFMHISGINYRELFHPSSNSMLSVFALTIFPVSISVIASFWWLGDLEYYISSLFFPDVSSIEMLKNLLGHGVISIIVVCLIAPFLEEMLFRGVILRGFLIHYSPINAILASSAIFGLIHLNIYQIPGAFILGCFVGWLFFVTKSLWPCIFAHSLGNAGAYIYYLHNYDTYLQDTEITYNGFLVNMSTFGVSVGAALFIYALFKRA